jgi:hypothetical protein
MRTRMGFGAAVLALLVGSSLAWAQDPAIVFVDEAKAGAKSIMVMDTDGGNRSEIFLTSKRFCDCGGPALSPAISPDGQWVTFVYAGEESTSGFDLLKLSTAGGTPEVLLCGSGDTGDYVLPESPQWSPDGSWIAVHLRDFPGGTGPVGSIAVLSAAETAAGCPFFPSQVEVVYPDPDGPLVPLLHIWRGIAWSPDSSRVAILEDPTSAGADSEQLTIVSVPPIEGDPLHYEFDMPVGFYDDLYHLEFAGLDWQRSGNLVFAFDTYEERPTGQMFRTWLLDLEGAAGVPVATEIAGGKSPTWAPDDSQLLIGASRVAGASPNMVRVSFPGGETEILGTGYDPDWRRAVPECSATDPCTGDLVCCGGTCSAPACTGDASCDDGDICTDDSCDPCTGCSNEFDASNDESCEPAGVDCPTYGDKKSCNAELTCRWDNRNGVCIGN